MNPFFLFNVINSFRYKLPIFFFLLSVFWGHIFPIYNYYILFSISLLLFLIFNLSPILRLLRFTNFYHLYFFLLFFIFSLPFSVNFLESMKFIYLFIIIYLNCFFIVRLHKNFDFLISSIIFLSFFHVLFTIFQYFFTTEFELFSINFLYTNDLLSNQLLLKTGAYAGLTGQTGVNSYFISIFIFSFFFKNKKMINLYSLSLLLLAIFALLITYKRSHLLFVIAVIPIIYFYLAKNRFLFLLISSFLFLFFLTIFLFFFSDLSIFSRIIDSFSSEDFSTGRFDLWMETINLFIENSFNPLGINSMFFNLGELTHNIYLQLLSELGVFFIIFFVLLLFQIAYKYFRFRGIGINYLIFSSIFLHFIFYGLLGNPFYHGPFLFFFLLTLLTPFSSQIKPKALLHL